MTQLLNFQVKNTQNPWGSPTTSWIGITPITGLDPIKAIKKAPKGKTFKIYSVHFAVQTIHIIVDDGNEPGNVNIDLNLWFLESEPQNIQSAVGLSTFRIARTRIYYNKFGNAIEQLLTNGSDVLVQNDLTGTISPGGGDVFTGTRAVDVEGDFAGFRSDLRNTDWRYYDPNPHFNYNGLIVSPLLYFAVSHGGVNNMREYGASASVFNCFVEYDLVDISEYVETRFNMR